MFSKLRLGTKSEDQPSSRKSSQGGATTSKSENFSHQEEVTPIVIDGQDEIISIRFLADGKHIVSRAGKTTERFRRWRVDDGREVGPTRVRSDLTGAAISHDGKWIVGGTTKGFLEVWNGETNKKVKEWKGHNDAIYSVDLSQDGTRIVTGSDDKCVHVWSRLSGEQLLGPLQHDNDVVPVKFSPDGRFIATGTWKRESLRVYDSQDGRLCFDVAVQVGSKNSIAWTSDGRQLFALTSDRFIHCFDASTGAMLAKWSIHGDKGKCIALAKNKTFIAAASGSTVSFWDISTREQVGSILYLTHDVRSMTISDNLQLAVCGEKKITIRSLQDMFQSLHAIDDVLNDPEQPRAQETSNSRIAQLERTIQDLRRESQRTADDQTRTINSLHADINAQKMNADEQIQELRNQLDMYRRERDEANLLLHALEESSNREISCLNRIIHVHERKHGCETLFVQGRILDAAKPLPGIEISLKEDRMGNKFLSEWLTEFSVKCIKTLEENGDEASTAGKKDEAIADYAAALSLSHLAPATLVTKWARMTLISHTASKVLSTTTEFRVPRFVIYQTICNILEGDGRLTEAVECFCRMKNELPDNTTDDKRVEWERSFREDCVTESVKLGDAARDARKHEEAIQRYWDAILLEPATLDEILLKYSTELIELNPSSHEGYQKKHAALKSMGRYNEAFEAFQSMLLKVRQSRDPRIQELRHEYVDVTPLIKQEVQRAIGPMPRLLIDTETGRLYDKTQQAVAFEALPIYHELRSSMTTRSQIDLERIQDEVKTFYRYVMFSHRWELNGEPVLHDVQTSTVYVLEATLPNIKLQMLCKIARGLGFKWVWSDTCCIDKDNNVVLQESLVAMFSWYRGSALTLIHLRGVLSDSQQPGDLRRSVWNSRVWTYQEYLAAGTVQFYTEDWKLYLGLDIPNHKNSPQITAEMEPESGISAQESAILQPGLDRVREKLSLASSRETTFPEDIAYSLFGIFNASIPVIYGERYRAVGRLLEYVLAGSRDVKILAWTGSSGEYNSCLPHDLTVYKEVVPPHIPQPIMTADMGHAVTRLRSSGVEHSLLHTLHDRLRDLPKLRMSASRLELSGIVFQIPELVCTSGPDPKTKIGVYRTTTSVLGDIEITTSERLSEMKNLRVVHPWIRPLLDQEFAEDAAKLDKTVQALRLLVRLRQPFGALLFQPLTVMEYKRVAVDSLITVRIREEVSLAELIDSVSTIEVQ